MAIKAHIDLLNTDGVEAAMTITLTVGEWKGIRARLDRGKEASWTNATFDLSQTIAHLVEKVEARLKAEEV